MFFWKVLRFFQVLRCLQNVFKEISVCVYRYSCCVLRGFGWFKGSKGNQWWFTFMVNCILFWLLSDLLQLLVSSWSEAWICGFIGFAGRKNLWISHPHFLFSLWRVTCLWTDRQVRCRLGLISRARRVVAEVQHQPATLMFSISNLDVLRNLRRNTLIFFEVQG